MYPVFCIYFNACGRGSLCQRFYLQKTQRGRHVLCVFAVVVSSFAAASVSVSVSASAAAAAVVGFAKPTAAARCPANVLRSRIFSRLQRENTIFLQSLLLLLLFLFLFL